MKPIIGFTMSKDLIKGHHSINSYYMNAILSAGGIPMNIPMINDDEDFHSYLTMLDGIVFTGGGDVSPLIYNENPIKEVHSISSLRDRTEFGLFKLAYEMKMPILGVCRGLQVMNVVLGGSLYQDINIQLPGSLGHQPAGIATDELYHSIEIKENTKLYDLFGSKTIFINSNHHQSIKKLGDNLIISAVSEDGIIEAIEGNDERFLMGLQFHPECLVSRHPEFLSIFKELIIKASKFKV